MEQPVPPNLRQETVNSDPFRGSNTEFQVAATVYHTNSCRLDEENHAAPSDHVGRRYLSIIILAPNLKVHAGT